jgi:hypothetical protein
LAFDLSQYFFTIIHIHPSLCKVPFLLIAVFGLAKLDTLQQLGLGQKSPCKTFLHGQMFYNAELLSCMAAVVWLTGSTNRWLLLPSPNFFPIPIRNGI